MTAVIGDIHGCYYTLFELVERLRRNYEGVPVYCVGDLVDRGNFSFEVVELIKSQGIIFTPGNHDYMFYHFIKDPGNEIGKAWLYNGYESTITSYNNRLEMMNDHLDMIGEAPLFINLEDCFISHAGISVFYKSLLPDNYLNNTAKLNELLSADLLSEHSILWNREELIDMGKLQIVGHTPQQEVNILKKNNTAYIDTSAYKGNKLSAVLVENNKIRDIISVATYRDDLS